MTKTLIWEVSKLNAGDCISKCLIGMYRVQKIGKRTHHLRLNTEKLGSFKTQDLAKDAAQLNYEQHLKPEC